MFYIFTYVHINTSPHHHYIALTEEISSDVLCVGFSVDKDGHMSLSVSAYHKNILGHI